MASSPDFSVFPGGQENTVPMAAPRPPAHSPLTLFRDFVALLPLPYSAFPQNKRKKRKKKKKAQEQGVAFSRSPEELQAMWSALAERLLQCAQVGGFVLFRTGLL